MVIVLLAGAHYYRVSLRGVPAGVTSLLCRHQMDVKNMVWEEAPYIHCEVEPTFSSVFIGGGRYYCVHRRARLRSLIMYHVNE